MKRTTRLTVQSPPPPLGGDITAESIRVGLYLRVSTGHQVEGESLEEQESELRKYCAYRNFGIHKLYIERGKSGGNTNRPEYKALVRDIQAGKFNAVVVKKIDRLSRSLLDFEALMVMLESHNIDFISLREQFDTTTAIGKAMLRITLIFAQLEREQNSERVSDVMAYRASQGHYNGGICPFGYDAVNTELVPHKQERKAVSFMFDTFLQTHSTAQTAALCNTAGFQTRSGQSWDKRQIHKILIRPVYKGCMQWAGQLHKGLHQPLVTESKYDHVQQIFESRQSEICRSKIKGLLIGILQCSQCTQPWVPNYTQKKTGKKYYYYRCRSTMNPSPHSCKGQYLTFEAAHDGALSALLACTEDLFFQRLGLQIDHYNATISRQSELKQSELDRLKAQVAVLKQKRISYIDTLVTGKFSASERTTINDQIEEFQLEEKQLEAATWRLEFDISELISSKLDLNRFKETMAQFRFNHVNFTAKDWKKWFTQHVVHIIHRNGHFDVTFRYLAVLAGNTQ